MLCIVIADDHPLLRVGVAQLLKEKLEARVEQVSTIPELRVVLETRPPDLLILDLTLSGGNRLKVMPELRLLYPALPILVLSADSEKQSGVKAILAGATGHLSKAGDPEELVVAVRTIAKGGRYISPELGRALAEHVFQAQSGKALHEKLSAREHSVPVKISEGFTTAEIAKQLELSPKTVGTYPARVLDKMGISTTAGLTRHVVENSLEKDPD